MSTQASTQDPEPVEDASALEVFYSFASLSLSSTHGLPASHRRLNPPTYHDRPPGDRVDPPAYTPIIPHLQATKARSDVIRNRSLSLDAYSLATSPFPSLKSPVTPQESVPSALPSLWKSTPDAGTIDSRPPSPIPRKQTQTPNLAVYASTAKSTTPPPSFQGGPHVSGLSVLQSYFNSNIRSDDREAVQPGINSQATSPVSSDQIDQLPIIPNAPTLASCPSPPSAQLAPRLIREQNLSVSSSPNIQSIACSQHPSDATQGHVDAPPLAVHEVTSDGVVYKNLYDLVLKALESDDHMCDEGVLADVQDASTYMASRDVVETLLHSQSYRMNLLNVASSLVGVVDSRRIREALGRDEAHIGNCLKTLIQSPADKKRVFELSGDDAQAMLRVIQFTLDKGLLASEIVTRQAYRLLVKLSEISDEIPSHLAITGTTLLEDQPVSGGSYSDVYRGEYRKNPVAVKKIRIFNRDAQRHDACQRIGKEALVWQSLKHPYILPFLGIDSGIFPSSICLVSPWMKYGTILQFIQEHGMLDLEQRILELAKGLAYLHWKEVVHGDLRGGNILVDADWHVRIADFGLTVLADQTRGPHSSDVGGSTRWMAPELLDPSAYDLPHLRRSKACDVYAFGCTCLEIYTQAPPFSNDVQDSAAMLKVISGIRPEQPTSESFPTALWPIVESCWRQHPTERPTASALVRRIRTFLE